MKIIAYLAFALVAILFGVYLLYPNKPYPVPPPDAVQSQEEADTEDPERRAYFTNYKREELMAHYKKEMSYLPTLRLNYPPEDAQSLVRDQTRSRYLEEYAHPFRESVFVNGFFPEVAKDDIWYKGVHYETKVTIRYVTTNTVVRLGIAILSMLGFLGIVLLGQKIIIDFLYALKRIVKR